MKHSFLGAFFATSVIHNKKQPPKEATQETAPVFFRLGLFCIAFFSSPPRLVLVHLHFEDKVIEPQRREVHFSNKYLDSTENNVLKLRKKVGHKIHGTGIFTYIGLIFMVFM